MPDLELLLPPKINWLLIVPLRLIHSAPTPKDMFTAFDWVSMLPLLVSVAVGQCMFSPTEDVSSAFVSRRMS